MPNKQIKTASYININQLELLKFELIYNEHIVSLIDPNGYEIVRGYGNSIEEAINDMHRGLI